MKDLFLGINHRKQFVPLSLTINLVLRKYYWAEIRWEARHPLCGNPENENTTKRR